MKPEQETMKHPILVASTIIEIEHSTAVEDNKTQYRRKSISCFKLTSQMASQTAQIRAAGLASSALITQKQCCKY